MNAASWAAELAAQLPPLSEDQVRQVGQLAAALDARAGPDDEDDGGPAEDRRLMSHLPSTTKARGSS